MKDNTNNIVIINNKLIASKMDLISNDINQYILGEKLGEGIFGTVKLGIHKITKEKVAIKILNKNRITKEQKILLERELNIHKKLNHFNIIKLYSIIETESKIFLIQEYSEGKELSLYIQNHAKIDEKEICRFFQQIISGVEYIHSMGIAHRDLKPENILLTRANDIKIADFGLSNFYTKGKLLKTSCGSPYYAPPEMLQGKPYNGLYSDIYSCGIILYYMLTHKLPFNEKKESDTYKKILSCKFEIPKKISKNAQDLLKKIIKLKPEERIKLNEIKNHPWFNLYNAENNIHNGLNNEKVIFPIDEEVVQNMEEIGFNKMEVRYNIIKNEHNNITATYYLLLEKKIKKGRKSVADLHSELFEDYINDPKNSIENYGNNLDEAIKHRINSKKILEIIPDFNENKKVTNKRNSIRHSIVKKNSISTEQNQERKSISCKKDNKINNQIIPKPMLLTKEKDKNNITLKINKKQNKGVKKERNLSAIIKPNKIIIDIKNNNSLKQIIKPKPLKNKTIQSNYINSIKNKINRRLSTENKNKNLKPKIQFNGVLSPIKNNDKNNIFSTRRKSLLNKKKLPFLKNENKAKFVSSNNKINQKNKINFKEKLLKTEGKNIDRNINKINKTNLNHKFNNIN